jgi:hypothetical protein
MWTPARNALMRRLYPAEGASPDLCEALGLQQYQVIAQASM